MSQPWRSSYAGLAIVADIVQGMRTLLEQSTALFGGVVSSVNEVVERAYKSGYEAGREDGYQQGYQAGRAAMREAILRAADTPPPVEHTGELAIAGKSTVSIETKVIRAPRGSVGQFVTNQLSARGGLTLHELQAVAEASQEGIAPSSISNELQRNKSTKYKRHEDGRWSLIEGSAADAEPAPAAQEVYQPAA